MQYPLHTISKPVVGREAEHLARVLQSGGYVANEAAIATAKRIAARRNKIADATKR
ncbi:MAG: hypothetical protein KME64_27250 [Scytonematopsis contorta HA4267-MV1]|jgi:hypothetical protein|nr:hypothetical protein [Scytonematopsis contorta HA4267-MV1]